MPSSDCTIVVSSNDENADLWDPFFRLLEINWSQNAFPIVLNTRSLDYSYEGLDITTLKLYKSEDAPGWCERLKKHLKAIETEYVLCLADDFFCYYEVDQEKINSCINWMNKHKNSVVIYLEILKSFGAGKESIDINNLRFIQSNQFCMYKANTGPAIWRRKKLIAILRNWESIWDFELDGSVRAGRFFGSFWAQAPGTKEIYPPPFTYENGIEHNFIHHGQWSVVAPKIFEKYNIDIDYDKRGFYDPHESVPIKYGIKKNIPKGIFTKIFWKEMRKRIRHYGAFIT